jgi:Tfp pilus assembly protein FimT
MEANMPFRNRYQSRASESGFSVIELLVVVGVAVILGAIALPQMISARRMLKSSAMARQVMTQLRLARQEAMSQRQAITVQYDDTNKRLVVIDHNASGRSLLTATGYPNTAGSVQIRTINLAGDGLPASEISYGIPSGAQTAALDDSAALTVLPTTTRQINITFQPDGSVIDGNGNAAKFALYFYNSRAGISTASAVSVLGAGGRVKIWRYDSSANVNKYVE